MLVYILRLEHWDNYARGLIKQLLLTNTKKK